MSLGFVKAISLSFVGTPRAWMSSLSPWAPSPGCPRHAVPTHSPAMRVLRPIAGRKSASSTPSAALPAWPSAHFAGWSPACSGMEAEADLSKGGSFRLSPCPKAAWVFLVVLAFWSACRVLEGSAVQHHCPGQGVQARVLGRWPMGREGHPSPALRHPTAIHQGSLGWACSGRAVHRGAFPFLESWAGSRCSPPPSLEPLAFTPAPALGSALGTSGFVPGPPLVLGPPPLECFPPSPTGMSLSITSLQPQAPPRGSQALAHGSAQTSNLGAQTLCFSWPPAVMSILS